MTTAPPDSVPSISSAEARARLERATEHCFMAGVGDVGMQLCAANVPFGLAKIQWAQEQLGHEPDATFVGAPDATITRNNRRWSQGFGYGGMYAWSGEFAVLDIKPNACGMSVGALSDMPALEEVRARLKQLDETPLRLDGVTLDNDLTESNHFVDVLDVADEDGHEQLPGGVRHVYIMHSSGHEHRQPTSKGPGLYWDQSDELRAMARIIETPWGRLHVLEGQDARTWYEFYRQVQDFNHRRREVLARHLFGDHEVLINATHQGMVRGVQRANIGCYTFQTPATGQQKNGLGQWFPLTLSPTLPAYLVRPFANISETTIDRLGWRERIERHGLAERIRHTNLLPHGGGYAYPQFRGVARVIEHGPDDRRFELSPASGGEPVRIETPRGLSYAYRGMEVKERMEELELGRAVVKLDLRYVLTA